MNEELAARFPEMTPIKSAPTLSSINGVGLGLHGRRDFDPETGTYVSTQTFTLVFVPLLALKSYRIANNPHGGWYFVGRVPLSRFARRWNLAILLVLLLGAGGLWWNSHINSADYKAGVKLAHADRLAASGQANDAAQAYRELLAGPKAAAAQQGLNALFEDLPESATEAAGVLAVGVEMRQRNQGPLPDLTAVGTAYAAKQAAADPAGALEVLDAIAPLATDPAPIAAEREKLLERLVQAEPKNLKSVGKLASLYDSDGRREKCAALLTPLEAELGESEAAAILGRIRASAGEYDKAHRLLLPYVAGQMPGLNTAETQYQTITQSLQKSLVESLQSGQAPGFDYASYRAAPQAVQDQMIGDYLDTHTKDDPRLRAAVAAMMAKRNVVPAALDLGMVQLHRGRAMNDPAERKRELEAAEQTFLSVRGLAGQSADYQITLGQVYFWLGKAAEGRKLIDEMLKTNTGAEAVMAAGNVLREVGEVDAARSVVEAGYNRQTEARPKQALAELRSLMMKDNSDQIAWLNRADTASPHVRASLASANGFEALLKGNRDEARGHYEAAVAAYDAMPESAATLNNSSLALNAIYSITADPATFKRAADRIDRALALRPSDSILLTNGLSSLMDAVIRDAVGTQIDLAVLGRSADWSMLNFLYHDDAGFEKVYGRVGKHPGLAKSRIYAGKLTLLAPKSTTGYSSLDTIFEITRDESAMARLVEQVRGSGLQDTQREAYLDYLDSKDDAKTKADFEASRARAQAAYDKVKGRKDATFAFAAAALANAMIGGTTFGLPMSADDAVALGQAAQAAAPSVGSQAALEAALLYRAHTKLMASNSAYAAQAKLTQRSFGSHLTRFYLGQTGPIGDAVRAQPDVKTYVKMQIDDLRSLSQRPGAISVYVARAKEPALAKAAEAVLTANRIRPMTDAINGVLSPRDLDTMFRVYFRKLVAGDRPGAHAAVTALVELGVPVPKFE